MKSLSANYSVKVHCPFSISDNRFLYYTLFQGYWNAQSARINDKAKRVPTATAEGTNFREAHPAREV